MIISSTKRRHLSLLEFLTCLSTNQHVLVSRDDILIKVVSYYNFSWFLVVIGIGANNTMHMCYVVFCNCQSCCRMSNWNEP